MVGTPVGTDDYIKKKLGNVIDKYPSFFRRLKMMDPQCGLLLLDDWKTLVAFEGEITEDVLSCLTLPFREGGCGLRSMEQNSPIAHYASVVGTYQTVGTVFPAVQEASKAAKEAITGVFAE